MVMCWQRKRIDDLPNCLRRLREISGKPWVPTDGAINNMVILKEMIKVLEAVCGHAII